MRRDHQEAIFEIIKKKINNTDSLGNVVGEILSISQDAVYRRYRGETLLTIFELEKLSKHFNISLDSLFEVNKNTVLFDFKPLEDYEFSMDVYLQGLLDNVKALKNLSDPELIVTVNNLQFLQLLNFPHLIRFKLFFWAKTYLKLEEYRDIKFEYEKISSKTFDIGLEVLKQYNTIPSKEIYDIDFLRGFSREIYYNYKARLIADPKYALYLLEVVDRFIDHLEAQAIAGKKFVSKSEAPASGNEFQMYYNESNNGNTSIYYSSKEEKGLFLSHNLLNYVHTSDKSYLKDSYSVLQKQINSSSLISSSNEKERNNFFFQIKKTIDVVRKKIELDLE